MAGLLAACVLALLVTVPTANACLCFCGDSVALSDISTQTVQNDKHGDKSSCDAACCLSGHCHQVAPMLNPLATGVLAPAEMGTNPSSATKSRALASRPIAGPDRPPRA